MNIGFGMARDAYGSFLGTVEKNALTYSTMIHGFVCDSDFVAVIDTVIVMGKLGLVFDHSTLASFLRAFVSLGMLEEAIAIHCRIVKTMGHKIL